MTILALLFWLIVLGVGGYLIVRFIPMAEPFPKLVMLVLVIIAVLLIAQAFGLFDALRQPVPKLK